MDRSKREQTKLPSGEDFLDVAAEVTQALQNEGLVATLVGGAVCAIYTNNQNGSSDIDFISTDPYGKIESALAQIGFVKDESRNFIRRKKLKGDIRDMIFMDYVGQGAQIGEESVPRKELASLEHNQAKISILTPTHAVMDRLSKFMYHTDTDALNHAVAVAKKYPINLEKIRNWCEAENGTQAYEFFLARLRVSRAQSDAYSEQIAKKLATTESK
jgi:hypothetical protein